MSESFASSGEVFVDRSEMIFQRLVKILIYAVAMRQAGRTKKDKCVIIR